MKLSVASSPLLLSLLMATSTLSFATEIRLPGITITEDRVQIGDVSISEGSVVITEGHTHSTDVSVLGTEITNADHSRGNFQGNSLQSTRIYNTNFSRSNLSSANLQDSVITRSNFSRATIKSSNMRFTQITDSNFSRAKLGTADLAGARITGADFSRTNFDGANLSGITFENSNFSRASFVGACLAGARFINSNFSRANFTGAVLTNTNNDRSEFSRAVMKNVDRTSHCGDDSFGASTSTEFNINVGRDDITAAHTIVRALTSEENSKIDLTVYFDFNSDQLDARAFEQIVEISAALTSEELRNATIVIEGHTDSRGKETYNDNLSYRRAQRIKNVLVNDYGMDKKWLEIKGLGESAPIASNALSQGRALNRRVTLVNTGTR